MIHFRLLLSVTCLLATADASSDRVTTCEGDLQRLACDVGVISVQAASYGRSDSETCSEGKRSALLRDTSCSLPGTDDLLKKMCDGKKVCELNTDVVQTSDPCSTTFKYLQTNYTCLPAHHLVLCERSETHLHCDGGQVISVLGADYGRRDRTTCSYKRTDTRVQNVYCSNPTSKVAQSCDGKTSCRVKASNAEFGDPCTGTNKYLELAYVCQYPV